MLASSVCKHYSRDRQRGDAQEKNTPEDDDVKVEDVRDAERKAEDYAEYAGPEGFVLACARYLKGTTGPPARTIVRIYLWRSS